MLLKIIYLSFLTVKVKTTAVSLSQTVFIFNIKSNIVNFRVFKAALFRTKKINKLCFRNFYGPIFLTLTEKS